MLPPFLLMAVYNSFLKNFHTEFLRFSKACRRRWALSSFSLSEKISAFCPRLLFPTSVTLDPVRGYAEWKNLLPSAADKVEYNFIGLSKSANGVHFWGKRKSCPIEWSFFGRKSEQQGCTLTMTRSEQCWSYADDDTNKAEPFYSLAVQSTAYNAHLTHCCACKFRIKAQPCGRFSIGETPL